MVLSGWVGLDIREKQIRTRLMKFFDQIRTKSNQSKSGWFGSGARVPDFKNLPQAPKPESNSKIKEKSLKSCGLNKFYEPPCSKTSQSPCS